MREILFRGKRVDIKEWVWGYYAYSDFDNSHYIVMMSEDTQYTTDNPFRNNNKLLSKAFKVIPESVGQYTELNDKNGKKIFEGDVVEVDDEIGWESNTESGYEYDCAPYKSRFAIGWNEKECAFGIIKSNLDDDVYPNSQFVYDVNPQGNGENFVDEVKRRSVIIGNITDNSELLEATDEI